MGPSKFETDDQVQEIALDAMKFIFKLKNYIPVFMNDQENLKAVNKTISTKMRQKLSKPATYAALQTLMRLSEFCSECQSAFKEDRTPSLPKNTGHFDYTLRYLWIEWMKVVEEQSEKKIYWKSDFWNPYSDLSDSLDTLISYLWKSHFRVMDL